MSSIIVIDDDPQINSLLKDVLEFEGYQVVTAQRADEGLQYLESGPVDLVVTDVLMPEKEGLETIRELRQRYPQTKILAISGGLTKSGVDVLEIAKRLGAHRVLRKPFDVKDFIQSVRLLLDTEEASSG
ncbi:MAG: response regulator [Nitrospirae bacterium]|nr:response regulator [Nitrospirota bacterium]MDA1304207.1 response regulator [Nitrospirota bacterium]